MELLPVTASDPQLRIATLERELHWADLKIQSLMEEMRQLRIQFLGPKSETLSSLQLELLAEEEPSATRDEVEAEARREPVTRTPARERKPHPGRKPLPENLPRVEEVIACVRCTCAACGEQTAVIGYDESELLDVEPAHYFVRVTKREKRACRRCDSATVIAAPLAERIVEKGLASDAVVINTVVGKYCDHLPLYRQAVMLEREAGVEIGRATLDGWVMRVGELLTPVIAAMRRDLLNAAYLQADETTVPVQMHDKRGEGLIAGQLWFAMAGCDRIRHKYEARKIIDICNPLIINVLQRVDIIDAIAVIRDLCGFQIFVYAASDRTFRA
jgi:transposase